MKPASQLAPDPGTKLIPPVLIFLGLSLSCVANANPLFFLLVDMKSLRNGTEVGFREIFCQISSSMCSYEQQQHADTSCVWSSRE